MYLHLPEEFSLPVYKSMGIKFINRQIIYKKICMQFSFPIILFWYRQHWSSYLASEYYILLIKCAHVIDLYGHAGLCYMTGEV